MKNKNEKLPIDLLAAMTEPLSVWYEQNRKSLPWREDNDAYHVWLSEIMLQQTRTTAVIPYYLRFLEAYPTVEHLAATDDEVLMKLWEGLGYYSRARNLKAAAIRIRDDHGGKLPADYRALLALPGIGEYTAGAVASISFGLPEPAVDGNVLRVVMRLCACDWDIAASDTKKKVTEALRQVYPEGDKAGVLTQAIMELGENVCIPNGRPRCIDCPLAGICRGLTENLVDSLPRKSPKKARRIEKKTVFLIQCDGRFAIRQRPAHGLLAGLWEFPTLEGHLSEEQVRSWLQENGMTPTAIASCGTATHIFTHKEWHMIGYRVSLTDFPDLYTASTPSQLLDQYAIPKAFEAFRALCTSSVG